MSGPWTTGRTAGRLAALATASLLAASPAPAQDAMGGPILHTAFLGGYSLWLGQSGDLESRNWAYGGTLRYFGGASGGTRLGFGANWLRNNVSINGRYRTGGRTFTDELRLTRLGGDLYYGLPPNRRGNVPYFLAGGGQLTAEGETAGGATAELEEGFWEVGMGIINGGSNYTAFALELKYIGKLENEVRSDDGMIQLSMSVGYNW